DSNSRSLSRTSPSGGTGGARRRKTPLESVVYLEGDRGLECPPSTGESVLTSAFHAYRRKDPAFAGSVSLDETRERDVLAPSRLRSEEHTSELQSHLNLVCRL